MLVVLMCFFSLTHNTPQRQSINNIAYLRGLFPENAFHPTVLDTLDKLTVQFLQKGDDSPDEVQHLLNWFEDGVLGE